MSESEKPGLLLITYNTQEQTLSDRNEHPLLCTAASGDAPRSPSPKAHITAADSERELQVSEDSNCNHIHMRSTDTIMGNTTMTCREF